MPVMMPSADAGTRSVGNTFKLTGEVTWRCTVETTMNENGEAEVNLLWDVQPVKFIEKRPMLSHHCRVHESGGGIQD